MKRIYIYGLLTVISFGSCKKYLDEKPDNAIATEDAIVDAGTANAAITGAYSQLQNYYANYVTLGIMPADNVIFNGTLSQYLQLDQNAIPTDNVITVAVYRGIYQAINSANSVIDGVPKVSDPLLTDSIKNRIIGEAYFIRALGYFDLARGWGGVQLQLKPTADLNGLKGIKRSSLDETYNQVEADLKQAQSLLSEDASTRNRARKSTATALLARLALYRENWADAENYASQVIANSKYSLVKPFNTFFTSPFLSSESVFELTFSVNDKNSYWNLWYPSSSGGQYTLKPSDAIVTKLNNPAEGGTRSTLIAGSGNNVYGVLYNTVSSSTDPLYVIRIAELYLIRAEARARQGKLEDALNDLNAIRSRAGATPVTATTQAAVLNAIEEENSIEFAFEAHRWFDLVRTKRAGEVLGVSNKDYWLFPIPLSDVQSDPDVTQNPGY